MKAFMVYPGESPWDSGCLLVYAETHNKARYIGWKAFYDESEYIDMHAIRKPAYDQYCDKPDYFETNDDLPEGAPDFYQGFESDPEEL